TRATVATSRAPEVAVAARTEQVDARTVVARGADTASAADIHARARTPGTAVGPGAGSRSARPAGGGNVEPGQHRLDGSLDQHTRGGPGLARAAVPADGAGGATDTGLAHEDADRAGLEHGIAAVIL